MNSFITSRGIEVQFCGIATLLDKLEGINLIPDPPTYQVELPGTLDPVTNKPRTEMHAHDETTVSTETEQAQWAKYVEAKANAERKHQDALMRLLFLRGIKYPEPVDDSWVKQQEFVGLQVPTDPLDPAKFTLERRLHYVQTEIVGTVSDIEQIMMGVMEASSVPQETLAAIRASFRSSMGQSTGSETGRPADGQIEPGVVLLDPLRGGKGSDKKRHT